MGSILSALYAERYDDLSALVLSGTPVIKFSHIFQFLAGLIARTRGQLTRSPLLEKLTGSAANLSLDEAESARTWLTRDAQKIREFCQDPLCGFDYSAGGYYTMLRGYHDINSKTWGKNIPDIPILVTGGAEDTASGSGNGPAHYAAELTQTGHTQVDLQIFPDCRHEILNELNHEEIYTYLCDWFKESTKGRQTVGKLRM